MTVGSLLFGHFVLSNHSLPVAPESFVWVPRLGAGSTRVPPATRRPTLTLRTFRPRKLRAESPQRLPSSKRRMDSGLRTLDGSYPAIRHHPLVRLPTAFGGGESFPRMEGSIWGLRVDLGCQIGSKAGEQIIV